MTRRAIWLAMGLLIAWPAGSPCSTPTRSQISREGGRPYGMAMATLASASLGRPLVATSVRDILFSRDGRAVYVASDQGIWQGGGRGAR